VALQRVDEIVVRRVRADGDWHGGKAVFRAHLATNGDAAALIDPDVSSIATRAVTSASAGTHFCLGTRLAWLDPQVVIAWALEHHLGATLAVKPGELSWPPTIVERTLRSCGCTLAADGGSRP
jgi:cytochrome P450